jgi:tRNA threonylcarbamoyladenosine biosynthesis protein TsaB
VSDESFLEFEDKKGDIICFGPGAQKVINLVQTKNIRFVEGIVPSVLGMSGNILDKFNEKCFENTAYFEPFYLKEFIAGKPKRSLLHPD